MTEKGDGKDNVERMRRQIDRMGYVVVATIFIGLAFMISSLFVPYFGLDAKDHMTDPSIPYNELENATFTWTADELADKIEKSWIPLLLGAGMGILGVVLNMFIPSRLRLHKTLCEGPEDGRYCSECGVRLVDDKGERRDR